MCLKTTQLFSVICVSFCKQNVLVLFFRVKDLAVEIVCRLLLPSTQPTISIVFIWNTSQSYLTVLSSSFGVGWCTLKESMLIKNFIREEVSLCKKSMLWEKKTFFNIN